MCEVSAQGRENEMSYFSFDLINLMGLLPSPQSQLNYSLPAAVEELQSAQCRLSSPCQPAAALAMEQCHVCTGSCRAQ